MKVSLNWLKQYVDIPWSPADLTERLTMLGLEVEGVEPIGGEFTGIVVAQVITRDPHPNADKLSVCRVHDGTAERQIVCGAQNFKAGDKVPLILPGSALPTKAGDTAPFVIKVGKIRGVESQGMMCSAKELGISEDAEGLLLLKPDAQTGTPFAEYLGRAGNDVIYDLEITPNRPDLNSVIGIAREISALTGCPLRIPPSTLPVPTNPTAQVVDVRLEAPDLCPRYVARLLRGVRIGPSPDWLRQALEKIGIRSINNVVDVTNYVMIETGQPLHAFDLRQVARAANGRPTVVVRTAGPGEAFTTLDKQLRTLTEETLLIADPSRGIALAGIMGGLNSEIQTDTTDVLLESAYFAPTPIRRTSKALGLRSEASYRFERGADPGACDWVSRRAAELILQTAGGHLEGCAVDANPTPVAAREITLRHARIERLLGVSISDSEVIKSLSGLGLESLPTDIPDTSRWSIPSWRVDLKREVDLIEEVARLHGVDRIPSTPPRGTVGSHPYDSVFDQLRETRNFLVGMGLHECQGQTLIPGAAADRVSGSVSVSLANPLSSDMDVLRPSLIPGLLDILSHNVSRKNTDLALFEIGRVFLKEGDRLREQLRVAAVLTGTRMPGFWSGSDRDARYDIHDLKGVVEELLEQFGLRGHVYLRRPDPMGIFLESATLSLGGKLPLGEIGLVQPAIARAHDLRDPVLVAELHLDTLLARRNSGRGFKALPQFPASRRDVAMLVAESVTHEQILQAVKQAKAAHLENVELFDVFRGSHVPDGLKSMAYAITYRGTDKTLTEAEINTSHDRIIAQWKSSVGAQIRG